MLLSRVDQGKEGARNGIDGGRGMRSKLYQMGLVPGARVMVKRGNSADRTMVAVRDFRLAVGREMSQKIIVG